MNSTETRANNRQAAVTGLAVVGFVALVAAGMWLAVYSARYVPVAVDRIGAAAVSLGSIFVPNDGPSLSVVPPTGTTTIPFGNGTTTTATSTTGTGTTTTTKPTGSTGTPKPGQGSSGTYQIGSSTPALYGLPDLVVQITAVGYLTGSSTDTFVQATTIPHGTAPAVKFIIKNVGTNVAGAWRFSASIPTTSNPIYQSIPQQSLNPGDYIEFTLGFTQPNAGSNQTISVTANFDHAVAESNTNNNSASSQITILGS